MADEPAPAPVPTPTQLKQLVEAAAAGSKAAQDRLEQLCKDHEGLAARVAKLEAATATAAPLSTSSTDPAVSKANTRIRTPFFWKGKK